MIPFDLFEVPSIKIFNTYLVDILKKSYILIFYLSIINILLSYKIVLNISIETFIFDVWVKLIKNT